MFTRFRKSSNRRLGAICSYCIYYGPAHPDAVSVLKQLDMVILEPQQWSSDNLSQFHPAGTTLLGYLSVMETPKWNENRYLRLEPTDLLLINGMPHRFTQWDSVLMDLRSSHYINILLDEIEKQIVSKRLHGVFLDTVGDIEEYVPAEMRLEITESYRNLLAMILKEFPALKLVQNRGFEQLAYAETLLDGFLWEDWRGNQLKDAWVKNQLKNLKPMQQGGLKLFSQSAYTDSIHRKTAENRGFIHFTCPQGYNILSNPQSFSPL